MSPFLMLFGHTLALLKVVPDISSFLDDEREHAETISANHMDMCKFASKGDPGYRALSGELGK